MTQRVHYLIIVFLFIGGVILAVLQDAGWVNCLSQLPVELTALQKKRLSDTGSLTQFLQSQESPKVRFELLGVDEIDLSSESHYIVSAIGGASVCCRTVLWAHQAVPWVYAESWIPEAVIQAHPAVMKSEAPLGKWLFNGQSIQYSAFEFALLPSDDALIQRAACKLRCQISALIARRRQYTMADQYSLVVVEVFFESCMQYFSQCGMTIK